VSCIKIDGSFSRDSSCDSPIAVHGRGHHQACRTFLASTPWPGTVETDAIRGAATAQLGVDYGQLPSSANPNLRWPIIHDLPLSAILYHVPPSFVSRPGKIAALGV